MDIVILSRCYLTIGSNMIVRLCILSCWTCFSICPRRRISKGSRWDPELNSGWHNAKVQDDVALCWLLAISRLCDGGKGMGFQTRGRQEPLITKGIHHTSCWTCFSICPRWRMSKGSRWDPELNSGWHNAKVQDDIEQCWLLAISRLCDGGKGVGSKSLAARPRWGAPPMYII